MKAFRAKSRAFEEEGWRAYALLLPWIAGVLLFTLWPMLQSLFLSFADYRIYGSASFVGLENFREMFFEDRMFKTSVFLTFK